MIYQIFHLNYLLFDQNIIDTSEMFSQGYFDEKNAGELAVFFQQPAQSPQLRKWHFRSPPPPPSHLRTNEKSKRNLLTGRENDMISLDH